MLDLSDFASAAPIRLLPFLINLIIAAFVSFVIASHYIHFGRALSNRREFAWILPFITLTTVLIITIVKSSLALSLGLVGALSIVRFRTPIKEPEELAYLFISIAVGLGVGASQTIPTVVAVILILGILTLRSNIAKKSKTQTHFLNIEIQNTTENDKMVLQQIDKIIEKSVYDFEIRRADQRGNAVLATYFIDCKDKEKLFGLIEEIKKTFPGADVSLIQHNNVQSL